MFTVFGSGFGLYGYLPALIDTFGEPVALPESYRATVQARPELARCLPSIRWAADRDAALALANRALEIAGP